MIRFNNVTITPSSIDTGGQFVLSVDVEASGFTWKGLLKTTWRIMKEKTTWKTLKGGA